VTNGSLTSPTPAAFYAHATDSRDSANLAVQLLEKFRPEVALGGGSNDFLPMALNGRRKDGRDLLSEFRKQGCRVVRTKADLENTESFQEGGVIGAFAPEALAFGDEMEAASQQPSLADMVRRAISFLQQNGEGYLLVVDASLVGIAAERNEGERAMQETIALDKAITTAEKYAGEKSLIIAAGRHSTAGMSLNGFPLRQDRGVALLGFGTNFTDSESAHPDRGGALSINNGSGYPYITWATGPNGPAVAAPGGEATPAPSAQAKNEPGAFHASTGMSNAEDVIVVGRGAGAERLHGFMDNTEIFKILKSAL
jgi:alkaline phosphatase